MIFNRTVDCFGAYVGEEDAEFEHDGHEGLPCLEGLALHHGRVEDERGPPLQRGGGRDARDGGGAGHERELGRLHAHRLFHVVDGEG